MRLVIDASVAIKWYVNEPGSEDAQALLEQNEILLAPAHALAEIGQVLVRRLRQQEIGRPQVEAALEGLKKTLLFVPLDQLVDKALVIAAANPISFYDALYVSAATQARVPLLTSDQRLLRALKGNVWSSSIQALGVTSSHPTEQ